MESGLSKLEWQASFSVGNELLDKQHQKLLSLCRQAVDCLSDDSQAEVVLFHIILNDLSRYVNEHFRTEETLLRQCGYAQFEEHRKEHVEYQIKLTDLLLSSMLDDIDKEGLHHYLSDWWTNHILGTDMLYLEAIRGLR